MPDISTLIRQARADGGRFLVLVTEGYDYDATPIVAMSEAEKDAIVARYPVGGVAYVSEVIDLEAQP